MERFKYSPDGEMLAVWGRRGYVHLVDWGAGGVGNGGQVVGEVKMNVAVKGIAWQKGGKELVTLGEDSEVYVWDVGTRRCVSRWRDNGGFGACGIESDARDAYTAVAYVVPLSPPAPLTSRAARRPESSTSTTLSRPRTSLKAQSGRRSGPSGTSRRP
mgnify:FL=1